ncbi:MAG: SecDF P1 head subdomain-containing protein, partial [Pyrinomonadaceae bacterium]
ITGQDLRSAKESRQDNSDYTVVFFLQNEAASRLAAWNKSHVNHYVAIVFDGQIKSISINKSQTFDQGEISGPYSAEAAKDIALVLNSGALPARVKKVETEVIR